MVDFRKRTEVDWGSTFGDRPHSSRRVRDWPGGLHRTPGCPLADLTVRLYGHEHDGVQHASYFRPYMYACIHAGTFSSA